VLIQICFASDRYGHEKLPLKIIKEKQSYIVGHERDVPMFDGSGGHRKIFEHACKATFVKSTGEWKLYWMRASGKWNLYEVYDSLDAAMREVKKDPNGCFWG
jgi:hypothetical protein